MYQAHFDSHSHEKLKMIRSPKTTILCGESKARITAILRHLTGKDLIISLVYQ